MPDKAIDVIDEAGAKQRMTAEVDRKQDIDVAEIEDIVSKIARIPARSVSSNDIDKLANLEKNLKMLVFGQDEAISALASAIKLSRAGLRDAQKTIGSFIFAGPTGVGKTEVTRQLAKVLGVELIRFDMSEYMERHTVSRLIGAPPGYVGFDQGGLLTEQVTKHPHAVLLLDELEKAHPDVYSVLLQVLDDGILTDGLGRKVDFKNTLIIMTSNIGARQLKDFGTGIGFATGAKAASADTHSKTVIENAMKRTFAPEFLNRIDDVIVFNSLTKEHIHVIIDIMMKDVYARVQHLGFTMELSKAAKDFLSEKGYDEKYGARPLHRAIQKYLEDPLAEEILNSQIKAGDIVMVDMDAKDKEKLKITVKKLKKSEKSDA